MLSMTVLMIALFFAVGYVLTTNVTHIVNSVIDMQMDENINIVSRELSSSKSQARQNLQDEIVDLRIANTGGVLVIDGKNTVLADSQGNFTGTNVATQPWLVTLRGAPSGVSVFDLASTEVYAKTVTVGAHLVCAYIPTFELNDYRTSTILIIALFGGFGILVFLNILYFAITRSVIRPLERLVDRIGERKPGEPINTKGFKKHSIIMTVAKATNNTLQKTPTEPQLRLPVSGEPVADDATRQGDSTLPTPSTPNEPTPTVAAIIYEDIFRQVAQDLRESLLAKQLKFTVTIDRGIPHALYIDSKQLRKIKVELLNQLVLDANDGGKVELLTKLIKKDGNECTILMQMNSNSVNSNSLYVQRLTQVFNPKITSEQLKDSFKDDIAMNHLLRVRQSVEGLHGRIWTQYEKAKGLTISYIFVASYPKNGNNSI
jgi:hypothetical protein